MTKLLHNKKAIATILVAVLSLAILITAITCCLMLQPKAVAVDNSGKAMYEGQTQKLPRSMTFVSNRVSAVADNYETRSINLDCNVEPISATNKKVDWSVAFVNPNSEWATGKNISDYLTIKPYLDMDGSMVATLTCKQPFGEQARVTVVSRDNDEAKASCSIDFQSKLIGVELQVTQDGTTQTVASKHSKFLGRHEFPADAGSLNDELLSIPYETASVKIKGICDTKKSVTFKPVLKYSVGTIEQEVSYLENFYLIRFLPSFGEAYNDAHPPRGNNLMDNSVSSIAVDGEWNLSLGTRDLITMFQADGVGTLEDIRHAASFANNKNMLAFWTVYSFQDPIENITLYYETSFGLGVDTGTLGVGVDSVELPDGDIII